MLQLKAKGIFAVRCACHSLQVLCILVLIIYFLFPSCFLQLVLKDFQKEIPVVQHAVEGIESLLLEHASTPERVSKFLNAQVGLGREPKHLKRIACTRCGLLS